MLRPDDAAGAALYRLRHVAKSSALIENKILAMLNDLPILSSSVTGPLPVEGVTGTNG
jgi:hypothetical protein